MTITTEALIETPEESPQKVQVLTMEPKARTQWKQWLAAISATLSMVSAGTAYGWTTTIMSRLINGTGGPVKITESESSSIVSVTIIGSAIGAFLGAWLASKYGRKFALLFTSLFYIAGWLVTIFAESITGLCVARTILGIGIGMSYTTNPMYVSEVADTNIRGALSTLIAVNVYTGSLFACSVGPWVSYKVLGIAMMMVPIIFIATFIWFPESPYYLALKGRKDEAMKAIAFFKGIDDPTEAEEELQLILKNINSNVGDSESWEVKIKRLFTSNNLKAFGIVSALVVAQQFSGCFITMQYLETLFAKSDIGMDSHIATIIVAAVGLVCGTFSTGLVERAGRKPLLIISTLGTALTAGILATYLLLVARDIDVTSIKFLPVIDIILFQTAYQVGLGTLPNALIGELFPTSAKGIAGAAITILDGAVGSSVSESYQAISTSVNNNYVIYFIFSGSCVITCIFVILCVPETKGKSFHEIQGDLRRNNFKRQRTNENA